MKKKAFKFKLGDKVSVVGRVGICVIVGRGSMEFTSGGNSNHYFLVGAYSVIAMEDTLISDRIGLAGTQNDPE